MSGQAGTQRMRIWKISELTRQIKQTLEDEVGCVWVEGEISNCKVYGSGHTYFVLKDEKAQLNAVLFAGTRVLLDCRLKELGIDATRIPGYAKTALTHMDVALEVFSGAADVGIGILAAARMLDLDFVPLATERFDLVIPTESCETGAIKSLREVLSSPDFKSHIRNMGGYETRDTGKIVYERG